MIQDFKKALSERKLPQNLAKLNIILFFLTAMLIIISSVEYNFKRHLFTYIESEKEYFLYSKIRYLSLI
jgi:hypothetical protein